MVDPTAAVVVGVAALVAILATVCLSGGRMPALGLTPAAVPALARHRARAVTPAVSEHPVVLSVIRR